MSILDDLFGNTSANAAKSAAADTYGKQQAASAGIRQAGDQYASYFQPYEQTGQTANTSLQNLLADPSSLASLPGYQFLLQQGTAGVNAGGAATGNLFSGKTGKALEGYGQNLADQTYSQQLNNLMGVTQMGIGATQAGEGGRLSAYTTAGQDDYGSAGTIGQGNIAAANAKTSALQNILGMATYLGGAALGGGTRNPLTSMSGGGNSSYGAPSPSLGYSLGRLFS